MCMIICLELFFLKNISPYPPRPFLKTSSNRAQACFHTDRKHLLDDRSGMVVYLWHAKFIFLKITSRAHDILQWRIQEFQNRGGRGPSAVEFLNWDLGILFRYPICIHELRLENQIHCTHCMLTTIKLYACYAVKFYKNKPKIYFKQGTRARCAPVLDPPLYYIVHTT